MTIWDDIDARRDRLQALRRTKSKGLRALDRWYAVELTYTSNAIEGNTLTRQETALVLDKGLAVEGKPVRDIMEALDHEEALALAKSIAASERALDDNVVFDLHKVVLKRSQPDEAGYLSRHQRRILGSVAVFPSPAKLPAMMEEFGQWLAGAAPNAQTAIEAHWRLVAIHPFSDGNGRTARLLMNLILFRGGYSPIVVDPERRRAYIDTLEAKQKGEGAGRYEDFMTQRLIESLDDHIKALLESSEGSVG